MTPKLTRQTSIMLTQANKKSKQLIKPIQSKLCIFLLILGFLSWGWFREPKGWETYWYLGKTLMQVYNGFICTFLSTISCHGGCESASMSESWNIILAPVNHWISLKKELKYIVNNERVVHISYFCYCELLFNCKTEEQLLS